MTTHENNGWGTEDLPQTEVQDNNSFPDKWKDEFEGMLFIGHLQREVTKIPFHKFVVKTLTVNDKLEVSLITKPYLDSIGYGRAYQSAIVAAGLVSVDGSELVPSNKNINVIRQKFDYVTNNWYDSVVELLYNEIESLENQVVIVLQELGILDPIMPLDIFKQIEEDIDTPKDGK